MNTRILMVASAVVMAAAGIAASFFPAELARYAGSGGSRLTVLLIQATGALYLGFAFLNWTAKGSPMGGIYGRPVAIGNLTHFLVMALALSKAVTAGERAFPVVLAAGIYAMFAVAFGLVMFRPPRPR